MFLFLKIVFLTENQVEDKIKQIEEDELKASTKGKATKIDFKKTVENAIYVGYDDNELTDFPGYLEAPQLLNNITNKMNFKVVKIFFNTDFKIYC